MNLKRMHYYFEALFELAHNASGINPLSIKKPALTYKWRDLNDIMAIKEVVLDRDYEDKEVCINYKDRSIVDVGAGIGDFTVLVAKLNTQSRVYSFEPDPYKFMVLMDNIQANKLTNVRAENVAINSIDEVLTMCGKCDFLKIDCEGGEFEILKNLNPKNKLKVKKIAMEWHDFSKELVKVKWLISHLERLGYKVKSKSNRGVDGLGLLFASY